MMRLLVLASTLAVLVLVGPTTSQSSTASTPSNAQLLIYKNSTQGSNRILRTMTGKPVQYRSAASHLNKNLIRSEYFLDPMTHLLTERIPERVVHAKGPAAFGYFEVTHEVTNLTKAKFLDSIGKQTRIAVRFSPSMIKQAASDLSYNVHGFAVKFYTEDGNFDIPGINIPVFVTRDPGVAHTFFHSLKPNPVTNMVNANSIIDFLLNHPPAFSAALRFLSPMGLPASYRTMNGFSVHTMQLANSRNDTNFARFYFTPDLGVKNLTVGSTSDNNYLTRDLYDAIGVGNYPSWTVWMQPLSMSDVTAARNRGEDVFDLTRTISTDTYPLQQVGKFVLNENQKNFFAQVEQLAFNPGNVVPGIIGAPDKIFEGRTLFYLLGAIHRLGPNFNKIAVNRPIMDVCSYNRDGSPPTADNEGGAPHYYPNHFNGPEPVPDDQPDIMEINEIESSNIDQCAEFYDALIEADKEVLANNVARIVLDLTDELKNLLFAFFATAPEPLQEFANRVQKLLDNTTSVNNLLNGKIFFPMG